MEQIPLKRQYKSTRLHGGRCQKSDAFVVTVTITSNHTTQTNDAYYPYTNQLWHTYLQMIIED
jgi:hypothetical protein